MCLAQSPHPDALTRRTTTAWRTSVGLNLFEWWNMNLWWYDSAVIIYLSAAQHAYGSSIWWNAMCCRMSHTHVGGASGGILLFLLDGALLVARVWKRTSGWINLPAASNRNMLYEKHNPFYITRHSTRIKSELLKEIVLTLYTSQEACHHVTWFSLSQPNAAPVEF